MITRRSRFTRRLGGGSGFKTIYPVVVGAVVTLAAVFFNRLTYDWRLSILHRSGHDSWSAGQTDPGPARRSVADEPLHILAGGVRQLDRWLVDVMFRIRKSGSARPERRRVALVAVDEESVRRVGLWPWSRQDMARLLGKVSAAEVVGLDIIFNEPDPASLINQVSKLDHLYGASLDLSAVDPLEMDNDLALAKAITGASTVLGTMFYDGEALFNQPSAPVGRYKMEIVQPGGPHVSHDKIMLRHASRMVANVRTLRHEPAVPMGEGFMNLFPDPSGDVSSVPLFVHSGLTRPEWDLPIELCVFPALPLEMMRVALGGNCYQLLLGDSAVNLSDLTGDARDRDLHPVKGVRIVDNLSFGQEVLLTIPLNELGEMGSGFRNNRGEFDVYPAWEVLRGLHDGVFDGRLVVVGATARGAGHILEQGVGDGVRVAEDHAAMLSTMLNRDQMVTSVRNSFLWQQTAIIVSGAAAAAAMALGGVAAGLGASSLAFAAIAVVNYQAFFRRGLEMGMAEPLLSTLVMMAAQLAAYYLLVGRERRRIRQAFSLSVSSSILGYLESHPDRLSSLEGENRNMTVLFTDIRGFTSMSEQMSALDLAQFLNEYFTPMADIVMENMGTVDKFIGDGLMAFWNAPADNPYHARDAAVTALAMLQRLEDMREGWSRRGFPAVSIGCGINTGPMFAGYMGSEHRKNYTVMGDNVNIASRLEGINKVYASSILVTEATRDMLGGDFVCRVADKVRVSGKESPVVIYELLKRGAGSDEDMEEIAAFSRVFELYLLREFSTADALLRDLLAIRPAPIYSLYRDRLAIYKALPPPPLWDGTFSIRHK